MYIRPCHRCHGAIASKYLIWHFIMFRSSFIFILSDCPHSSEDLCTFCCNPLIHKMDDVNDAVKKLFLPGDLLLQLTKFNIGLHWVDTKHRNAEQNVCSVETVACVHCY